MGGNSGARAGFIKRRTFPQFLVAVLSGLAVVTHDLNLRVPCAAFGPSKLFRHRPASNLAHDPGVFEPLYQHAGMDVAPMLALAGCIIPPNFEYP
jgi:hypothetical protein